jgi:hypothetical protein
MQAVHFWAALLLPLLVHPPRQRQGHAEDPVQPFVPADLADDVAHHAAELGAQPAQFAIGALELLGVGVALMLHQRPFAKPRIRLPQRHPVLVRQLHQLLSRAVQQLGVSREGDRLRLYRRVHDHPREVGGLGRAGARRHLQALL